MSMFLQARVESGSSFMCDYVGKYSLCFKMKAMFGHKLRYEIKVTFGVISLKLRQTNWNVARNNVKCCC